MLILAFSNIIENALKFSQGKTVNVLLDFAGPVPVVKVTDQGIGIPADDLDKIFQPFFRSNTAMNIQGHGIGLAIVKTVFDLHRYKLEYTSEPGKGTTVTVVCGK